MSIARTNPNVDPRQPGANRGIALTIGAFDGVHRGHQDLMTRLVEGAAQRGLDAVCITFEPDPEVVLRPEREHRALSSAEERRAWISALGVSRVDVVRFTVEVAQRTPEEFVAWLCARYPLRTLWVGPDFALGRNRAGGLETLQELGSACGFEVRTIDPLLHAGRPISSSWIRDALAEGDVALAAELLGRPYGFSGTVVQGMRRGRDLGFPTANVVPPAGRALPADGVYCMRVATPDPWYGVANLGARPTFAENERLLEVHLLDFVGDLYGRTITVDFLDLIRGIQRFSGVDELREQIGRDVARARELIEVRASAGSAGRAAEC